MQALLDFLSFKRFIAADILICCYYVGAVLIPILLYAARRTLIEKVSLVRSISEFLKNLSASLDPKNRLYLTILFLMMFLAIEVMWRMMFEMMIGYFQMHDYLQQIAAQS